MFHLPPSITFSLKDPVELIPAKTCFFSLKLDLFTGFIHSFSRISFELIGNVGFDRYFGSVLEAPHDVRVPSAR